jgi:HEPN domain-containing protein
MNPLTLEWLDKADGDFRTAGRELRARRSPNYDAVCFHAQQSAEKYLKAVLQESGLSIPKTHNLAELLGLCLQIDLAFKLLQSDLNVLDGYAVQFRYPGSTATRIEAKSAYASAGIVREALLARLGRISDM